jgi:N-acetylglucosamine-6-phosphate deacetylase
MIALTAKSLYTPLRHVESPLVLIEDGNIVQLTSRDSTQVPAGTRIVDFGDGVLAPGFIDVHIHGGAGYDVMQSDSCALPAVEQLIANHGVTSYFPTTVTAPVDQTLQALDRLAAAIEHPDNGSSGEVRATPLGIHLEGPFLSHVRRGAHPPEYLLTPSIAMFERFWQAARGHIRLITIAPELNEALAVIAEASKRRVCVSIGHSDADLATAQAAVKAGARHATHVFNAMRPLDHRQPGILGEVLTNPNVTAEIIADGIHLDPLTVKLTLQAKGLDGAVLITDATSGTGMPDGRYRLGSFEFEVKEGRAVVDGKLAGSTLTMDRAVQNAMRFGGIDLQAALRPATTNPARATGLTCQGKLENGAQADFVVLTSAGEVKKTIIRGQVG